MICLSPLLDQVNAAIAKVSGDRAGRETAALCGVLDVELANLRGDLDLLRQRIRVLERERLGGHSPIDPDDDAPALTPDEMRDVMQRLGRPQEAPPLLSAEDQRRLSEHLTEVQARPPATPTVWRMCHPGLRCDNYPECESCGPPRQ